MLQSTPIRTIQKRFSISRFTSKTAKQSSVQQLKIEELQKKLLKKQKKCEQNQKEIKELNQNKNKLHLTISQKQQEIFNLNQKIRNLTQTITKLQIQLKSNQQFKQMNNINIKQLLQQKNQLNQNSIGQKQLRNILAKQNYQLNSQKIALKNILSQYEITLLQTRKILKTQKQNSSQLKKINQNLKLQIEQMQQQFTSNQKKIQIDQLYEYQNKIQLRINKQSQENNSKNNQQGSKQLICLLKQRINNLEQQLSKSQMRCKQLQCILVTK